MNSYSASQQLAAPEWWFWPGIGQPAPKALRQQRLWCGFGRQLANETISKSELTPHPYTCTLCTGQCIKELDHHYCKYCKKKKRFWVVSTSNPQLSFNTLLSLSSSLVGHHSSKNISFSWRQKLWSVQHVMTICCQLCKFQCPLAFQQHETSPSVDPISLGNVCSSIWNKQPRKFGICTTAKNHKW